MLRHSELDDAELHRLLRNGTLKWAGNRRLKIYGRLDCKTGRSRLKMENRVFFESEEEAVATGYRPCGHCMRQEKSPRNR